MASMGLQVLPIYGADRQAIGRRSARGTDFSWDEFGYGSFTIRGSVEPSDTELSKIDS